MSALRDVYRRIAEACTRAGRSPADVRLIAVSKLQTARKISALEAEGQREFGENYVQELTAKMEELPGLHWHLIGHLQSNKVKFVSGKCALIHSVDSLSLAQVLSKKAVELGVVENILLQVNIGGEESKEGWEVSDLLAAWKDIAALPALRMHGLMTMPPLRNQPEDNRPIFRRLRTLLGELRALPGGLAHPLNQLSMGTSHDFEVAIEEGATLVRVGTVLFGARLTTA